MGYNSSIAQRIIHFLFIFIYSTSFGLNKTPTHLTLNEIIPFLPRINQKSFKNIPFAIYFQNMIQNDSFSKMIIKMNIVFAIQQLLLSQYINQAQEMISKKNTNELIPAMNLPSSIIIQNDKKRSVRQNAQQLKNQKKKIDKIKIKYKNNNALTQIYKLLRITHIHNFLNHIVINEETIRNPQHGQSIVKTAFYIKTITEVIVNSDYIQIGVRPNQNMSDMQEISLLSSYMIDRFNSFGDKYFHMIAYSLQQIASFFLSSEGGSSIENRNTSPLFQVTKQELITSFMDSIKGKAYIVSIIPGYYIFSKELLRILGYNPQQFANDALRYRCMLQDLLGSENYRIKLDRNIHFVQCYIKLLQGKMKMQELLKESEFTCIDYLKDINQNKIVVKMKSFMPNPFIYCVIAEQILSTITPQKISNKPQKQIISQYNHKQDKEQQRIMNLFQLQKNVVQEEAEIRCGYKNKPRRRRRKSQCDYQY